MIDLSFLQYEPKILKHGTKYDDPWDDRNESNFPLSGKTKPKKVMCIDIITGIKTEYESMNSASIALQSKHRSLFRVIKSGKLYRKRYSIKLA